MKKISSITCLCLGLVFITQFSAFRDAPQNDSEVVIQSIENFFHQQLLSFEKSVVAYQQALDDYSKNTISLQVLHQAHLDTRIAFKRAEFLLEYNDKYAIKKSLNGPPLPSLEPKVPEIRVIEPRGLQVLDELMAEENIDEEAVADLLQKLYSDTKKIISYQKNIQLEHRNILEAVRVELVRIFTLGVTGFDTPGMLNAIPEATAAMHSLQFVVQQYQPLLKQQLPQLSKEINNAFVAVLQALEQAKDFDSFDRLQFLRQHINPLSQLCWQMHNGLGIESIHEVTRTPQPLLMDSTLLFDANFFNLDYYRGFTDADKSKAALGRTLFYDPILSENMQRACASCHDPKRGFTDGRERSLAFDGRRSIKRNSPTLLNSVLAEHFFYDLRELQIERQIKHVVMDEHEFNTDFLTIIDRLSQSQEYTEHFNKVYPLAKISKYSISNALAAYVASLTSFNSTFDRYARGETDEIDAAVTRGFNLFMGKAACGTCHFAPTFSGLVPPYYRESESEVLGVPMYPDSSLIDPDLGRFTSGKPTNEAYFYEFSFKTTTVRNVELTAPYMHNGAFPDLESVLNFYNNGGGAGLGINLAHQTLSDSPLDLKENEITDLIAFMNSLTDTSKVGSIPKQLPTFDANEEWNRRPIGGAY